MESGRLGSPLLNALNSQKINSSISDWPACCLERTQSCAGHPDGQDRARTLTADQGPPAPLQATKDSSTHWRCPKRWKGNARCRRITDLVQYSSVRTKGNRPCNVSHHHSLAVSWALGNGTDLCEQQVMTAANRSYSGTPRSRGGWFATSSHRGCSRKFYIKRAFPEALRFPSALAPARSHLLTSIGSSHLHASSPEKSK